MTWDEIGRDSLEAAKLLNEAGRCRSSVSRAYFAAYSLFTHRLPEDRVPKHQHVQGLTRQHFGDLSEMQQERLVELLESLKIRRITADYDRVKPVDNASADAGVAECEKAMRLMEANRGQNP